MKKIITILCLILLTLNITGCSKLKEKFGKNEEAKEIPPVEELYNQAMDNLEQKKFKNAIGQFEEIERTYPYSPWAIKAEIMSAYASYQDQEYDTALAALDRFVKLHPGNKDVAYAYYLKSLCYYEQITDIRRDQGYTDLARVSLQEVVNRFPETEYARDAQIKLDLVLDHLAGKEVEIGRFYLKQHNVIAAINRFKKVVTEYQTTSHVPEALHRLTEAYTSLGVTTEAQKYAAVLGYNYPGSTWYEKSYRLVEGKELSSDASTTTPDWLRNIPDSLKNMIKR